MELPCRTRLVVWCWPWNATLGSICLLRAPGLPPTARGDWGDVQVPGRCSCIQSQVPEGRQLGSLGRGCELAVPGARCRTKEAEAPGRIVEDRRCASRLSPQNWPQGHAACVHALTQNLSDCASITATCCPEASHPRPDALVKAGCCSTFRFLSGWRLVSCLALPGCCAMVKNVL
jgi:hypothetical protein